MAPRDEQEPDDSFENVKTVFLDAGGPPDAAGVANPMRTPPFAERYELERLLGEGGMGTVLLYRDRQIGRRVAAKSMRPEAAAQAHLRERFVHEAQVQGQLEHPSIVPVYDLGVDPAGLPYFTMKRVRGVTLANILEGLSRGDLETAERFPRRRLLGALASVCLAIDFAHRLGVLHRDLKPANVMLGDFGEVYVLDWGLAKVTGAPEGEGGEHDLAVQSASAPATRAGSVLGTPGYMAPEQIRGERDRVGPASDVYALGALLFEVLAGEPLHTQQSLEATLASTLAGADARPSSRAPYADVAPELDEVCVRATALDPGDRYASARALHDAVEGWLGGERDLELRRKLAEVHALAAVRAAEHATTQAREDVDARREAMREVGRALALDPTNSDARRAMRALLDQPPDELPPEVARDLEQAELERLRRVGRFSWTMYGSLFAFVPLLLWTGVRSPGVVVAFFVLVAATCAMSLRATRKPHHRIGDLVLILSSAAFALTASFFGPLLFTPGMLAINASAFLVIVPRRRRWVVGLVALLAMAIPFGLQLAGVLPPSYSFGPQGLTIAPGALALKPLPTTVLLAVSAAAVVIVALMSTAQIRDVLDDMQRRLMVHGWQLRALAPVPRGETGAYAAPPRR